MYLEKLDPNRELQVWQRVAAGPRTEREDIRPLLLAAMENIGVYRHLTGLLQGKPRQRMRGLAEEARISLDCLRGIQILSGHGARNLRMPPIPEEAPRRLLEKSFHRSRRQMAEYMARVMDPEFGILWQALADREGKIATVLAQLLGELER